MIIAVDKSTGRASGLSPMKRYLFEEGYGDKWPPMSITKGILPASFGSSGDSIKYLQQLLSRLGYNISGDVSSMFGVNTEKAVMAFQSAAGLDADGYVGKKTWDRLEAAATGQFIEPTIPVPTPTPTVIPPEKEDIFKKMLPYVLIGGAMLSVLVIYSLRR